MSIELDVRSAGMAYVAERAAADGGVITRPQLEAFSYAGEQIKLIDHSRGIRNPRQTRRRSAASRPARRALRSLLLLMMQGARQNQKCVIE